MADNLQVNTGTGPIVAADEIGGILHQRVKQEYGADGSATDVSEATPLPVKQTLVTKTSTYVRPADTVAYTTGDAWSTSTGSPAAGTIVDAARANDGSGKILDMVIMSDNTGALAGEIWIFDSSVTPTNDNTVFNLSDADLAKLVGVVVFTLAATAVSSSVNSSVCKPGLNIGFTCTGGSDNLTFLVKVTGSYTPASGETLTIRTKIEQMN